MPGPAPAGAAAPPGPYDRGGGPRPDPATGTAPGRPAPPTTTARPRRPGHRRGPLGFGLRLLAGRRRLGRGGGGEEALPPGEDLRRRPHPPVGPPAGRHGPRRRPDRGPPLRRAPVLRLRDDHGPALARPPVFPPYGYVITRHDLDQLVSERAAKAGAVVWEGAEAVGPLLDRPGGHGRRQRGRGPCPAAAGRVVRDLDDGPDPRDPGPLRGGGRRGQLPLRPGPGHAAGTGPSPSAWPCGATSGRPATTTVHRVPPRHPRRLGQGGPRLRLDLPPGRRPGERRRGPAGVEGRWKGVNTCHLMDAFVAGAPEYWGLSPADLCGAPTGGKLPMGLSVRPRMGPTCWWWATPRGPSTPSTARGSPTATRRDAWPRPAWAGPCPARAPTPWPTTRPSSRTPTASTTGWPATSCA